MKKYILYLLSSIALFSFASCDDFLEKIPQSGPTKNTYWENESDVAAATTGTYWRLRSTMMGAGHLQHEMMLYYGDVPTGMFSGDSWVDTRPFTGNYEWEYGASSSNWGKFYKLVNQANMVIEYTPAVNAKEFKNESERNVYIGEALFIRAYTYFYMVRLWSTVPYLTKVVDDAADAVYDVPLETEDNILAACLKDLEEAHGYLSWSDTHGTKASRANRGSVLALKAHILMWKNRKNKSNIDPQNYRDAIAAIEEIEQSGKYSLMDMNSYLRIWNDGGRSSETLFELPYNRGAGEKLENWDSCFGALLGYEHNGNINVGARPRYVYNATFLNQIDKYTGAGDQRRDKVWNLWDHGVNKYPLKYTTITYLDDEKRTLEFNHSFVLFRLSDMYLLRAEAHEELDEFDKARTYLKKVQSRAGIPESVTDAIANGQLATEICDERIRELFLEGHNLYDWIRNGQYPGRNSYTVARYNEEGYLWPVNGNLILKNKYAKQTPYWSSKLKVD